MKLTRTNLFVLRSQFSATDSISATGIEQVDFPHLKRLLQMGYIDVDKTAKRLVLTGKGRDALKEA